MKLKNKIYIYILIS